MYAAIHPDGLVIFSQATLLNTRAPTSPARNISHRPNNRGPPGILVTPIDPWWIRLAETESPPTRDIPEGETIVDWVKRVRIKVANETTKAFHMQPITKPAFASTTLKPKFTRTSTNTPPKSHDIPQYDENTILYNYKSYGTSIIKLINEPLTNPYPLIIKPLTT